MSRPEHDITELPPETREIVDRLREALAREVELGATAVGPVMVGIDHALVGADRQSVVVLDIPSGRVVDVVDLHNRSYSLDDANLDAIRRMEDEMRRRAQAAFAAIVAPPPRMNRAQRRAAARRERL